MPVVASAQMRELDRRTTEEYGIPSLLLMENAGRSIAEAARSMASGNGLWKFVVAAGPGNNGGDGFAAARYLFNDGCSVQVFFFGDREKAKGDALTNIDICEKLGIAIDYSRNVRRFKNTLRECTVAIDALLGTGAKGELRPPFDKVVEALNCGVAVLSVDLPSGVDPDTGSVVGDAVRASATVTLALPKAGLLTGEGMAYVGELDVADIGIPRQLRIQSWPEVSTLDWTSCIEFLMERPSNSHKGTFGHTAIVAGSVGMTGAATLAAEGALRIGTGLVTVLVPESLNDIMEMKLTEAMTIPVPQGKARAFGMASLETVLEYVNKWDSAVIGPGFGRDEDTIEFAQELIKRIEKPAIIDADGLYAVSRDLSVLSKCKAPLVITPHPGEMATMLGTSTAEVQSNRLEIARAFAKEHNVTVVLKGAGTVIAETDGRAYINTTGTPGMATGGTGDVLSGMIGGLIAQDRGAIGAANAAVYLHGLAGEIAARKRGEAAMLASDLADCIGDAIAKLPDEAS